MENEPETTESDAAATDSAEPADTAEPGSEESSVSTATNGKTSRAKPVLIGLGLILAVGLIASQVFLINSLASTNDDLGSLKAQIIDVSRGVTDVETAVSGLSESIATAAGIAAAPNDTGVSPAPAVPSGFLPRFTNGAADTALGVTMSTIEATEAYTGEQLIVDPADGTKRVWLVWSHWCPYCQQELPDLADWYPGNADRFANTELVTVTTSIDPARGNPLEPYLEEEQFPFPVLLDGDSKIAAQFGVSAFPFWV
jgi:peroxiredoxin